jgi:hypothetical protein
MEEEKYALVDEDDRIHWAGEEIAIAFSFDPNEDHGIQGTLHKHGDPEKVMKWAETHRKKLTEAGLPDLANEIIVITGKFQLEEINKMLSISGYVGNFYKNLC